MQGYIHSIRILCTTKCTCRYRGQHACDVRRLAGWQVSVQYRCDIKKIHSGCSPKCQDLPTVQPVRSRIGNIGEKIAEVIFSRFALAGMYDMTSFKLSQLPEYSSRSYFFSAKVCFDFLNIPSRFVRMSSYLSHEGFGQSSSEKLLIKFIVTVHVWPTGL